MKTSPLKSLLFFSSALFSLFLSVQNSQAQVDLSPERWGKEELEKYVRIKRIAEPISTGASAMVTGTSSSIALRSGLEALKQGGTAMDAALTIALTHTTLAAGCTVSFAGVITVVYYDAASSTVYGLDGGYNTVKGETDPLTIPVYSRFDPSQGSGPIPKGRTVLVPGFMAGLEAAHTRFGTLPFAEIFEPAIYFAEKGFPSSEGLSRHAESSRKILSRLPETRAVFIKEDGSVHAPGETFKQPALARTLRRVATEGAKYIYHGDWAKKFVSAVQRDGGKMTLEDMDAYQANWYEPIQTAYHGHQVYMAGGGFNLAGMLNLMEISDLAGRGIYTESPESFYWFCRIIEGVIFGKGMEGLTYRQEDWHKKEFAESAWRTLQKKYKEGKAVQRKGSETHHSDAVVVSDKFGNMAAILHSSNTRGFGESGLYIDGISIPDSATFQQSLISVTEPGKRLFNPTVPLIVLKEGRPVLGLSAIGSGIYEETIKCLFNALGFSKGPQEAIDAPSFVPTFGSQVNSPSMAIAVAEGAFPASLIEEVKKRGLEIEVLPVDQARRTKGAAAIITVDPSTGIKEGGSVRRFSLGY